MIQKRIQFVGLKKQSAKGSVGSTPATYGLGTLGGSILVVGIDQEPDEITYGADKRISPDENRNAVNPGFGIRTRAYPRTLPLLAYLAHGAIATTGAGPDYSHAITPALTLPYVTGFAKLGSEYAKIGDAKCNTLSLSWSERRPLEVEATFLGITEFLTEPAWTATTDETGQSKFAPPGGTFKVDTASGTPAVAKITGGRYSVNNNLIGIPLSASQRPDDMAEGEQAIDVELTLMPDDFAEWKKAVTGTGSGTASQATPVFGSFDLKFLIAANIYAQIVATKVAFTPDFPDGDPGGGPVELTLPGRVKQPAAGDAVTFTVANQTASY
jgi:hypothetical protein